MKIKDQIAELSDTIKTRDPITEWTVAIKKRIESIIVILFILSFFCCLIAPLFGPFIKNQKEKQYILYDNYKEMANKDMILIYLILWSISILSWSILIYNLYN